MAAARRTVCLVERLFPPDAGTSRRRHQRRLVPPGCCLSPRPFVLLSPCPYRRIKSDNPQHRRIHRATGSSSSIISMARILGAPPAFPRQSRFQRVNGVTSSRDSPVTFDTMHGMRILATNGSVNSRYRVLQRDPHHCAQDRSASDAQHALFRHEVCPRVYFRRAASNRACDGAHGLDRVLRGPNRVNSQRHENHQDRKEQVRRGV